MQAIQTTYKGPTNYKGSCIIAKAAAGRVSVGYDDALSLSENHKMAADALRIRLGWHQGQFGEMVSGTLPNGDFCHVFKVD